VLVEQASLSGRQVLPATLATLGAAAAALGGGPTLIVVGGQFVSVAARLAADGLASADPAVAGALPASGSLRSA